ncbi:MAG TPA: isoprenylcysteine carboxylmethyltransferase family protein [Xanthobacteraceae bacterium]|nr:isoprenylcysteine carboxylmethyltransferase family protein [Xanthobacteraceae bacterium]
MKMTLLAPTGVDIGWVRNPRKGWLLLVVATVALLFMFSASPWASAVRESIRWAGLGLILICIAGRTWCALYIGGRKTRALVTVGPYSVTRNPLYGFSIIGAFGVGAQLGSLSVALIAGAFAWIVHRMAVMQEERLLLSEHRDTFQRYLAAVPRFLPRLDLWKDAEFLDVRPRSVVTTFFDACFFLAAVPVAELCGYVQHLGFVSVLLRLP